VSGAIVPIRRADRLFDILRILRSAKAPVTAASIAGAQRTARAGPSKVARKPSPVCFTSRPRNRMSCWRTISLCCSSVARHMRSPSAAARFVESTADDRR
jgi:hypothetical protein